MKRVGLVVLVSVFFFATIASICAASPAELAKTKGSGWVNYSWTNPVTKKVGPKTTYIQVVDGYWVGCGYFK
jgi:hypothetical protein